MKRLLAMVLAVALAIPMMTTVAFAKPGVDGAPSGEAEFDNGYEVSPGDTIELDESWFYGKWTEREDGERHTYEESPGSLDSEFHKVSATWTRGGEYIEDVYFEDGDSYVTIEIKGGITATSDKEIAGTVKILLKDFPNMPNVTYTCKINRGDVVIKGIDEKSRMVYLDDKEFGLPDDYQEKQVRFVSSTRSPSTWAFRRPAIPPCKRNTPTPICGSSTGPPGPPLTRRASCPSTWTRRNISTASTMTTPFTVWAAPMTRITTPTSSPPRPWAAMSSATPP